MKKNLKIIIPVAIVVVLAIVGTIIFKSNSNKDNIAVTSDKVVTNEKVEEPKEVTKTNYMSIDGIYVDKSYKDEKNKNLNLVYLFYTINSKDKNFKVDSQSAKIVINNTNTYDNTQHLSGVCKYMSSYYYSDYLKDVYVGDTLKVVETFKIPASDLEKGKTIKIQKSQVPETANIHFTTDNIVFCNNAKSIAKEVDPKGYEKEINKRANANKKTTKKVKKAINGYEWSFYVNRIAYKIEFSSPNKFELHTAFGSNSGKYTVKNGYIFCKYSSNKQTVEIPYSWKKGDIDLDLTTAFDVKK